jgi:predicted 2-oxoglutarate/Fe(II)-dependent dioxygenase YbiX
LQTLQIFKTFAGILQRVQITQGIILTTELILQMKDLKMHAASVNNVSGPISNSFPAITSSAKRKRQLVRTNLNLPRENKLAFTLDGVLSGEECQGLISAAEKVGFQRAGIGGSGSQVVSEHRTSFRLISDDPALAAEVWKRVRAHVPRVLNGCRVIGLNEQLKFLRYKKGQYFAPHFDGSFRRKGHTGQHSKITLQLYLSDSTESSGGATRFIGGSRDRYCERTHTVIKGAPEPDVDCMPMGGRVLMFEHKIMHEGALVNSGVKYTIRTDIEYGPYSTLAAVEEAMLSGMRQCTPVLLCVAIAIVAALLFASHTDNYR